MPDLLFEVGLEEIPARMIAAAQAELLGLVEGVLLNNRLAYDANNAKTYSTPRRLAVFIPGVSTEQEASNETLIGPSAQVAFKGGEPTPAAYAFAKKAGVDVLNLNQISTPKGDYLAATISRTGRSTNDLLVEQLPAALAKLYWPKNMYWRAGKPERFVRPLRWLLALLDDQVVDVEFAGTAASNKTYGHRVLHGDQAIEIGHPSEYLPKLESAFVIADVESRRHKIRKALDAAARTVPGIRWREDHPLVDAVTHLTEWPSVLLGGFEAEYLKLPEEVLVTVMRDHQKYFALEDESGKLAPYFLAVLNNEANAAGLAVIRHGNERVLRSRFKDARFFWDFDQKIPLLDRVEMLKAVTFQKQLGSYWEKTEANLRVAERLADIVIHQRGRILDKAALLESVKLAKTDLTVELVKEFTELQGIVGGLYARAQGLEECVARSIYWQYRPASTGDAVPPTLEGQILGITDRINTICGMFAIGLEPTGSRDPFALRRAANAIVRIFGEADPPLTLLQVLEAATNPAPLKALSPEQRVALKDFFGERLGFYLREVCGIRYDVVNATIAAGSENVADAIKRAEALAAVRGSDDFLAISVSFKRMKNILRQADESDTTPPESLSVKTNLFLEEPEKLLHIQSSELMPLVEELRRQGNYREALQMIATLRPTVEAFFDGVTVFASDMSLRNNRLLLLKSVLGAFTRIADFSEIVTS